MIRKMEESEFNNFRRYDFLKTMEDDEYSIVLMTGIDHNGIYVELLSLEDFGEYLSGKLYYRIKTRLLADCEKVTRTPLLVDKYNSKLEAMDEEYKKKYRLTPMKHDSLDELLRLREESEGIMGRINSIERMLGWRQEIGGGDVIYEFQGKERTDMSKEQTYLCDMLDSVEDKITDTEGELLNVINR